MSFLPPCDISPIIPRRSTKAWEALVDLTHTPLTQIDWLEMNRGWRLAAAIKELAYYRWPIASEWVRPKSCANPIKRYRLKPEGLRLAVEVLNGGVSC